jgi:hypothetical protein
MASIYLPALSTSSVLLYAFGFVGGVTILGITALMAAEALDSTRPKVLRLIRSCKRFRRAVRDELRK